MMTMPNTIGYITAGQLKRGDRFSFRGPVYQVQAIRRYCKHRVWLLLDLVPDSPVFGVSPRVLKLPDNYKVVKS